MYLPIREYLAISFFIGLTTIIFSYLKKDKICVKWGFLVWLVLSLIYVLSNVVLFFIVAFFLLVTTFSIKKHDIASLVGVYLLLLPAIPMTLAYKIPFPGAQQFFILNYPRLLNFAILLPIFLKNMHSEDKRIFAYSADKYVALFLLYIGFIAFRDTTFTNAVRMNFYLFIDFFVLYFAVSRSTRNAEDFKKICYPLIFTTFLLALIAIFETSKHWFLYAIFSTEPLYQDAREGMLRARASFLTPIPFGVYFCIVTAFVLFLKYTEKDKQKSLFDLITVLLFLALLCTFSRGPLIGYAVLMCIFMILMPGKPRKIILLFFILILVLSPMVIMQKTKLLAKDGQTLTYRKNLWVNSMQIMARSPITGSGKFLDEEEMQDLKVGQSTVDVVNTYLNIALPYGVLGLVLFLAIFCKGFFNIIRGLSFSKDSQTLILGKLLLACLISFMVMIFGISMVSLLPIYMWVLIGLFAAYGKAATAPLVAKL